VHSEALKRRIALLFPAAADRLAQRAGTVPGGLQQRLAIARALMMDPTQLLLEEASAGLAPRNVQAEFEILPQPRGRGAHVLLADQSLLLECQLRIRPLCWTMAASCGPRRNEPRA